MSHNQVWDRGHARGSALGKARFCTAQTFMVVANNWQKPPASS